MNYSKKAMNITPSITLAITAKAKELKGAGVDVVSFGAGEPDFNTPENKVYPYFWNNRVKRGNM